MTAAAAGLAGALRAQGGLLAATVRPDPAAVEPDLAVAAIREGHDVHYAGAGRVCAPADPDLALLAGDALYALGLEELAARGDLAAVRLLADVISGCAQAQAEGLAERAEAIWADALRQLTLPDRERTYPSTE